MECPICKLAIAPGDYVFYGSRVKFCGPSEHDYVHSETTGGSYVSIHASCLERPGEAARMPNTAHHEPYEDEFVESVVTRSDALSLFEM